MKTKIPRNFVVSEDYHAQFGIEFNFENVDDLRHEENELRWVEKWLDPNLSVTPRISTTIKPSRKIRDIGFIQSPLYVATAEFKRFFELLMPGKMTSRKCHSVLADGSTGPELWLCRFDLTIFRSFDEARESGEHFFKVKNYMGRLICDEIFRQTFKEYNFKGFSFKKILTPEEEEARRRKIEPLLAARRAVKTEHDKRRNQLHQSIKVIGKTDLFPVQALATRTLLRGMPLLEKVDWQTEIAKKKKDGTLPINAAQTLLAILRGCAFMWWFSHGESKAISTEFIQTIHEIRTGTYNSLTKNGITYILEAPISTALGYLRHLQVQEDVSDSVCHSAMQSCLILHFATEVALGTLGKLDGEPVSYKDRDRWDSYMNRKLDITEESVWLASRADVEFLQRNPRRTKELLASPLWPNGTPVFFSECWEKLSQRLKDRKNEKWDIWVDWYNQRLNGGSIWRGGWEQESVMMETAIWKLDVGLVNSSLQQVRDNQRGNFLKSLGRIFRLSS